MKRFCLILALCSLWSIPAVVLAQEATTGGVRGHIIDISTTHLLIEGVRVVIVSTDGVETEVETDSNGEFEIIGLLPGRHLLNIYKDGYSNHVERVTVVAGGDHYVPMKMTKAGWAYLLKQKFGISLWLLFFYLGVALVLGYLIGRAGHRSD